jgi:ABC-type branched-subunit amino acid transport system substrate-binding protein
MSRQLHLASRSGTYLLVLGVVMGILAAGLAVPLAFGERATTVGLTGPGSTAGGDGSASDPASFQDETPGVDGTGPGGAGDPGAGGAGPGGTGSTGTGGTGTGTGGSGPGGGGSPTTAKLGASDRGVTADAIRVGVLIGEVGGAAAVGMDLSSFDAGTEQKAWQGYVDEVNSRGGINGRKLVLEVKRFDVVAGQADAACAYLTQDKKVFAVFNMGFFWTEQVLCVTERNRTPLLKGDPESGDDIFRRSRGYLSSTVASYDRQARNLAHEAAKAGALNGKKIGIVARTMDGKLAEAVTAGLQAEGHSVTHVSMLANEEGTAQSQIPTEVQKMKTLGVGAIFMVTSPRLHANFVQAAEGDVTWRPQYLVSDIFGATEDITTQSMPSSYNGALGFSMVRSGEGDAGLPEATVDRTCRETFERRANDTLDHTDDDKRYVVLAACDVVSRFEAAATLAGPNLTRDGLTTAITRLGARPTANTGGGSYGPNKTDAADYVRTKKFDYSCTCYRLESGFRKARY